MNYQYEIALSFATEEQDLVEKVYRYLKAENVHVFFAPSSEGQIALSGKNQREAFYSIFGLNAQYVALFVSNENVISYTLRDHANGDSWKEIKVIFNGNPKDMPVNIPKGKWTVIAQDGILKADGLSTSNGGKMMVAPTSALILAR